ncbi:MAG: cellulase family glycosylhydrolase [Muribaculaceae bacterium]|nr:cellulase family glycosylhydrolase [Muribaculaceae bacterium]
MNASRLLLTAGIAVAAMLQCSPVSAADRQSYKIYVDDEGVMRRSDNNEEVSYYGTNYTVPFAHAYRALGYLGEDRRKTIDRDVYQMARLGFNGFRLHLWDAELADAAGNLLDNEHLDLLDYLIARLEERGIDIILTAQTNFGNGYPEKNVDTGAFTYDFDKCDIHENPKAQKIQENYLRQLASHVNRYTGRSYGGDNAIIAMEINNEPCHSGTQKQVTEYINRMAKALRSGGFDKPILYNVSHNGQVTPAYYDADIQGTTYQWYPTGLVAGHERKGNFLPYVDSYPIPWKETMKNYDRMARVVYEFDPGDVLVSYLYPAIARTFRKEGFQWITQFAYDPTPLAPYNTEYQTHYLNLAYTPSKALSMLIAGEVARNVKRGADYGTFPADTIFADFSLSAENDFSLQNDGESYRYTNSVTVPPISPGDLRHIAGVGSSPVVSYDGTGAYFLDLTERPGVWRLEVMPDVMLTSDPFAKPSLSKRVGEIAYNANRMTINLPGLGEEYAVRPLTEGAKAPQRAAGGEINVTPGVYIIGKDAGAVAAAGPSDFKANFALDEYAAPPQTLAHPVVAHTPPAIAMPGEEITLSARVFSPVAPAKVEIYPSHVSFWREDNPITVMSPAPGGVYTATIPAPEHGREMEYNIVVTDNQGNSRTFPADSEGTPLDWDYTEYQYYSIPVVDRREAVALLPPAKRDAAVDVAMVPEEYAWKLDFTPASSTSTSSYTIEGPAREASDVTLRRYVGDLTAALPADDTRKTLRLAMAADPATIASLKKGNVNPMLGIVGRDGMTYEAEVPISSLVPVSDTAWNEISVTFPIAPGYFNGAPTRIIPAPYPTFLPRLADTGAASLPESFKASDIEYITLTLPLAPDSARTLRIYGLDLIP